MDAILELRDTLGMQAEVNNYWLELQFSPLDPLPLVTVDDFPPSWNVIIEKLMI